MRCLLGLLEEHLLFRAAVDDRRDRPVAGQFAVGPGGEVRGVARDESVVRSCP